MKANFLNLRSPKLFPVFLLLTLGMNAYSQGEFMHKGQSGVQLDGYYTQIKKNIWVENQGVAQVKNATIPGFGGRFGFSLKGTFDLQVSINGLNLPSSSLYPESQGTTTYGKLVIHLKKQSDKFPFSIRGILGYGYSQYDEISTTDTDVDFGLGISRRLYLRDNISTVVTVDYLYSISNYTLDNDDVEESRGLIVLSLPIAVNLPHNHLIHFAPYITYGLNETEGSMGFNLGYIIPFYLGAR